jgi:hypothetical protein
MIPRELYTSVLKNIVDILPFLNKRFIKQSKYSLLYQTNDKKPLLNGSIIK